MHQRSTTVSFELTPFIHMLKKPTISPISLAKQKPNHSNQSLIFSYMSIAETASFERWTWHCNAY